MHQRNIAAIRRGEPPDDMDKANTSSLAALWQQGKQILATLKEMKNQDFYESLDQLLGVDKIKNDFK